MSSDQPRRPREGGGSSGSPMGSTAAIIIAVVAVVAGFLILREILKDDTVASVTPATLPTSATLPEAVVPTPAPVEVTQVTAFTPTTEGATVVVANASTVNGAAKVLTTALQGAKFTMAEPTNATTKVDATTILYDPANSNALAVAESLAALMGNPVVQVLPVPVPLDGGVLPGGASVVVMLGSDKANQTLAAMGAPVTVPLSTIEPVGVSTATG